MCFSTGRSSLSAQRRILNLKNKQRKSRRKRHPRGAVGKLPINPGPPKISPAQNSWPRPVRIPAQRLEEMLECDFRTKPYSWVRRLLLLISDKGCGSGDVDSRVILAVMQAQRYRCPISGLKFQLPDRDAKVDYRTWLLNQPAFIRVASPIPIRPNPRAPFSVNNLLFIGEPFAMIYEGLDDQASTHVPGIDLLQGIQEYQTCIRFYEDNEER